MYLQHSAKLDSSFARFTLILSSFLFQGVVYKLIPGLEKCRNAELAERKEKHKKQQAAEKEAEKNKEAKGSTSASATESTSIRVYSRYIFLKRNWVFNQFFLSNTDEVPSTPPIEEQPAIGTASTSERDDSRQLIAAVEAVVEAVRQELNTDEEIIGKYATNDNHFEFSLYK